jgi:hypothetical protein
MKRKVKAGITSLSLLVFIQSTASTTGGGLGGVTHTTPGFIAEYRRDGQSSWTSITLVSKTLGTYTSGGFVADTGLDGCYEFDPPDAAVAAGARFVAFRLHGAANMLPVLIEIELDAVDYHVDAFGALKPTTAGRTLDVTATGAAGVDWGNVENQGATVNLSATSTQSVADAILADVSLDAIADFFPANFAILGINSSGHVSRVVLVDTTTTNSDMRGTDGAALATHWTATRAGYLDGVLIAANYNQRTVQVTGSNHVAADIHELQPGVIDNTHFAAGAIDANALAADAATEIATAVGTLQVLTDLVTMIVNDGTANARFSTSALQNAPSGGGGGSTTVNVLPYTGAVPDRVEGTTIKVFYNELTNVSVGVTDASGTAVALDAKTLRFCVEDRYGVDVLTLTDGDITRSGSTFTVQIPQSLTDTVGANYRWSLRDLTGSLNTVLIHGQMIVADAAEDEA